MCEWINGVLEESYDDGTWAEAFERTLGASGAETPEPPALDAVPGPDLSAGDRRGCAGRLRGRPAAARPPRTARRRTPR